MKRSIISMPFIAACIIGFFTMSSFKTIPSASASKALAFNKAEAITIYASSLPAPGPIFSGPVKVTIRAINAYGTYVMPTQQMGMALHCLLVLSLPAGTISIRLNCNLVTFNGVWKILEGTGAYQNLTGGGSLVMPNDTDEVLTGTVRGL